MISRNYAIHALHGLLLSATGLSLVSPAQAFSPYPQAAWYPRPVAAPYPVYRVQPQHPQMFAYARPQVAYAAPKSSEPERPRSQEKATRAAAGSKTKVSKPDKQPASSASGLKANKQAFLDRLRPIIEKENLRLRTLKRQSREQFKQIAAGATLDDEQSAQLQELARRYRVDGDILSDKKAQRELLHKIDEIPVELALAQAANESAWGKSRFAREGNNLFGIWTYDESKGMVPRNRAPGKKHLVRVFDSEADSVRYYMRTLNSHPAYAELRRIRADLRSRGESLDSLALAEGLLAYSAKGEEYVRVIRSMIRRFEQVSPDTRLADKA